MFAIELLGWFALGAFLGGLELYLFEHPYRPGETMLVGGLGGVFAGAIARLALPGEAAVGGFSIEAFVIAGAGAILAIALFALSAKWRHAKG